MKDEIRLFDNDKQVCTINKNDAWKVFLLLFSPPILLMIPELYQYFNVYQLVVFYVIYSIVILFFAWKILVKKYPKPSIYIVGRNR